MAACIYTTYCTCIHLKHCKYNLCSYIFVFNVGPPIAPINIRFSPDDITNESLVIQWDAVIDLFTVTYIVRWYRGDEEIGMASVDEPSYTVTGLTANTFYGVTVVAINTCCGAGSVSNVVMIMTNNESPTLPHTTTATVTTVTVTPTPGNLHTVLLNFMIVMANLLLFCTYCVRIPLEPIL